MKVGDKVRPAGHPYVPWERGEVASISDAPLRSGMRIGVRITVGALGYVGSVAYFRDDELAPDEG